MDGLPEYLPLPEKRVCDLSERQMQTFREWMGLTESGTPVDAVPCPSEEEKQHREKRERWKKRYAGKATEKPSLLIRREQIRRLESNAEVDATARRFRDGILKEADEVADLPRGFFASFIPDQGPWNCGGNFCPHCVHDKSPEGINTYFWNWDWQDPERLSCPYCGTVFPNEDYTDNGSLILPRIGLTYRFHIRDAERATPDWRLGDEAGRFVEQPIHVSFSGNIRALRINWAIARLKPLGLAFAITRDLRYVRSATEILQRFAQVYPRYPLQSYFQDVVDADPGYAVDNADWLPTVFKRNACIGVYDGRFGYGHERTTTRGTRVATGLWGASRIARELTSTGNAFLTAFDAYDLVRWAIDPETRREIEQGFLLELYQDVRAYEYITNKAGNIRASRVAFGHVYGNETEIREGVKGFHAILRGQFHPDGSTKETPLYAHKPIGENLWRIPETLRGRQDLYASSLLPAAFQTFSKVLTPWATYPTLDDTYAGGGVPVQTWDIARERCGIDIPGEHGPPSEFAVYNSDLKERKRRSGSAKALNHYYEGRHLACIGFGSGKTATQVFVTGEDGCRTHRHAAPLNLQLYTHGWEVFPDLGYICDHPGNRWVKATPSHQTVTIDEKNVYWEEPSELLAFAGEGASRFVDKRVRLRDGGRLRRGVVLVRKPDGWPVLVDLMEVEGGGTHDYAARVATSPTAFEVDTETTPRKTTLYQDHSFYPLKSFASAGKVSAPLRASWGSRDRRIRATVLTDATELITYRSPGWRNQHEITAEPEKYLNTLVLRSRKSTSAFLVVYETGPRSVIQPELAGIDDHYRVHLAHAGGKDWHISIPTEGASRDKPFRITRG